ncbi:YphA family membrane protein [Marininema halotolerans]
MVPGSVALICMGVLAVLIRTGWMNSLEQGLLLSRRFIFYGLLLQIALIQTNWPITSTLEIHLGTLLLFPIVVHLGWRRNGVEGFTLFSMVVFIGSLFFFIEEWLWSIPNQEQLLGSLLAGCVMASVIMTGSMNFDDRVVAWIAGILLGDFFGLIYHWGRMSPIQFGSGATRDFLWCGIGGWFVFYCVGQWFVSRVHQWTEKGE